MQASLLAVLVLVATLLQPSAAACDRAMRASALPLGPQPQRLNGRSLSPMCADGTPYVFFSDSSCPATQPAGNRSSTWVVFLSPGAFCTSEANCRQRRQQQPMLFTSAMWTPNSTVPVYDILSTDPLLNPTFHDATHAWLPYCSQDLWAGSSQANTSNVLGFTFRGEDNMLAAWLTLNITNAQVVLAGSSAGGAGAMRLANYLARTGHLLRTNVTLRLLVDSSWIIDYENTFQKILFATQQPPVLFFNIPAVGSSADPITRELCSFSPRAALNTFYSNNSFTTVADLTSSTILPCCLNGQCLLQSLFGSAASATPTGQSVLVDKGLQNGLFVISKYDVFSFALSGSNLPPLDSLGSLLSLLEDYAGDIEGSLLPYTQEQSRSTDRLTMFVPPCIGHVWLLPDQPRIESSDIPSLSLVLTPGMWTTLRANGDGPSLQTTIDRWWRHNGNVSNQVARCAGANCGRACPPILHPKLASSKWEDEFAVVMLIITVAFFAVANIVAIVCLVKFAALCRKIGWSKGIALLDKNTTANGPSGINPPSGPPTRLSVGFVPEDERVRLSFFDLWYRPDPASTMATLKGISLELEPGELIAIMGGSGCGKSTLLDIISQRRDYGVITGQQYINDVPVERFDPVLLRRSIGYVRQNGGGYFADLTVFDNLMFAALLRLPADTPLDARKQLVYDLAREVGLDKALDRMTGSEDSFATTSVATISGGQRRRLAVAVELISNPKILLLDEPTSGLDAAMSLHILRLLNELASKGRTVLLTIHQPRMEIFRMFGKLAVMHRGDLVMYDKPDRIVQTFIECSSECEPDMSHLFAASNVADSLLDVMSDETSNITALVQHEHQRGQVNLRCTVRQAELSLASNQRTSLPTNAPSSIQSSLQLADLKAQSSEVSRTDSSAAATQGMDALKAPPRSSAHNVMASLSEFGAQLTVSIARMNASMMWVFFPTFIPSILSAVVFALLFLNRSEGYIVASMYYCILATLPYSIVYGSLNRFRKDESLLRKDLDVNAVSPLAFTLASFFLCVTWLVGPLLFVDIFLLGLVLQTYLTAYSALCTLVVIVSNGIARVASALAMLGLCFRLNLGPGAQTGISVWFIGMDVILAGYFISPDDTPWTMRWSYYAAPSFYHYTAGIRILLSDVVTACDVQAPFFEFLTCQATGAGTFLKMRGLDSIDVGQSLAITLGMSVFYVLMLWVCIRFEVKQIKSFVAAALSPSMYFRALHRAVARLMGLCGLHLQGSMHLELKALHSIPKFPIVLSRRDVIVGRWKKALQLVPRKPKRALSGSSIADVVLQVLLVIKQREESINAAASLAVANAAHRRTVRRRPSAGLNPPPSAVAPSAVHVELPIAEVDETPNPPPAPATGPVPEELIAEELIVITSRSGRTTPDYAAFPESSC